MLGQLSVYSVHLQYTQWLTVQQLLRWLTSCACACVCVIHLLMLPRSFKLSFSRALGWWQSDNNCLATRQKTAGPPPPTDERPNTLSASLINFSTLKAGTGPRQCFDFTRTTLMETRRPGGVCQHSPPSYRCRFLPRSLSLFLSSGSSGRSPGAWLSLLHRAAWCGDSYTIYN